MTGHAVSRLRARLTSGGPRPRALILGPWLLVVCRATDAHAAFEYRLSANGTFTYTDNINNVSDSATASTTSAAQQPQAGTLFSAVPGLFLALTTPRGQGSLSYSHPFTYSPQSAIGNMSSDSLVASGAYDLTHLDSVNLSSTITRSRLTPLLFAGDTTTGVTGINNAGTQETWRLQLAETWSHSWSELVSTQQSTSLSTQLESVDGTQPGTLLLNNSVAFTFVWRDEQFSLTFLEGMTQRDDPATGATLTNHLGTVSGSWAHALDELTRFTLQLGLTQTLSEPDPPRPIGGLNVTHSREFTTWSLDVARRQAGDLQTGRVFTTDSADATVTATPFEALPLAFSTGGGVSRFESLQGAARSISAQASMTYRHDYFNASLSYVFFKQLGDDSEDTAIPSISRNAIMLSIGSAYPTE